MKNKFMVYNLSMPKRIKPDIEELDKTPFGSRLAQLRKKAGFSQRDLAKEMGISQRMIAYYEKETDFPPTHLLPLFIKALGVSADLLLGLENIHEDLELQDRNLLKRFNLVEKMSPKEKKKIMILLDPFIDKENLLEKVNHPK